jgi:MFS family permease
LQAQLEIYKRLERKGYLLLLGTVGCNLATLASLLLFQVSPALAIALFVGLSILAAALSYSSLKAFCEAKGQSAGWAAVGLVLGLIGGGLLALFLIAVLPDRHKEFRDSVPAGRHLYKPALYSIIIGLPMPYIGLPIAIHALLKITRTPDRWKGKGLAIAGTVVSSGMLLFLAVMILSDSQGRH